MMRNEKARFWQNTGLVLPFAAFIYGLTWLLAVRLLGASVKAPLYAIVITASTYDFLDALRGRFRSAWISVLLIVIWLAPSFGGSTKPLWWKSCVLAALLVMPLVGVGFGSLIRGRLRFDRSRR